jgi:hypothetical protein
MDTGCIQCHALNGEQLPGVMGVDLARIDLRLRSDWFRDFLRDPAALKPGTRMPTFFPQGRSSSPTLLGGDVDQQINAMWQYLAASETARLPDKLVSGRQDNFELVPDQRPILLRTFMEQAGTHAIAVGFPEGLHLAYDAEACRPGLLWKGKFLNAHGTWFDRFAPPAKPLGRPQLLPPGPAIGVLSDPQQAWPPSAQPAAAEFRGYRLDAAGVPTFLWRTGRLRVEERWAPAPDASPADAPPAADSMRRRLVVHHLQPPRERQRIWVRLLVGKLRRLGPQAVQTEAGLTVRLLRDGRNVRDDQRGRLRQSGETGEWLVPLVFRSGVARVEAVYQW